jgi:hypothetical protein
MDIMSKLMSMLCDGVDLAMYCHTFGAGNRDRTGSIPAWQAGAPPFMRHLHFKFSVTLSPLLIPPQVPVWINFAKGTSTLRW